jgi:undecaprenyl-diphosphatase
MEIWQALILGIVQGLTEFLPVSSSGHLLLVQDLMNITMSQDETIAFDVALHAGTLVALFSYFRNDIAQLIRGFFASVRARSVREPEQRMPWLIIVGTVPALVVYKVFEDQIRAMEHRPLVTASMLIAVSFVFIVAERFRGERTAEQVTLRDAILIGLGQAAALIPGTSRSGATISTGMFLGFDRAAAARFSFLLSAPVVLAAVVLSIGDLASFSQSSNAFLVNTVVGFVASAVSGYVAVSALLRFLGGHSLAWFAAYRIPAGIFFLIYCTMVD